MALKDLTDDEVGTLILLDFDPELSCDGSHEQAPVAQWRVMAAHRSPFGGPQGCEWRQILLCDGCLNHLHRLAASTVICRLCREQGVAREWWRLLGRI